MAEYKSDVATINYNINLVYSKLSNPDALSKMVDMLPAEARDKVKNVQFTTDSIAFQVPNAGQIELKVVEHEEPNKIVYSAVSSPVAFKLIIKLDSLNDNQTSGVVIIDIDIPIFLKPMISGPLKEGVSKFKEILMSIPYDRL